MTEQSPTAAVMNLVSAQEELAAAVTDMVIVQREIAAALRAQADTQREQTAATKVLHVGVKNLVKVVLVGIVLCVAVGVAMLTMGSTLVEIVNQNRDTAEVIRGNSEDSKAQLAILRSVTGPDAQARQAASLNEILLRNAVETDCRNRRLEAGLRAPNPATSCQGQTDPSIYPG